MVLAGGEAFKYWASLIIEHSKAGAAATKSAPLPQDEHGNPLGAMFNVKLVKNHVMPESPFQYAKFSYYVVFGKGVDEIGPSLEAGLKSGLIVKHGAWLYWMVDGEEKHKFNGKVAFREEMEADPKMWKEYSAMLDGDDSSEIESLSEEEIEAIEKENKQLDAKKSKTDKLLSEIDNEKTA